MTTEMISTPAEVKEQVRLFTNKFRNYYGEGHVVLAMHAAFPTALTVDLLYQLWANFKSYEERPGSTGVIPMLAVSDVLLSSLLRPTAKGIYEMSADIRIYLLEELKKDERFGPQRIKELASFLYQYASSKPDTPEWKRLREVQSLTAVLAVDPAAATTKILEQLAEKIQSGQINNSIGVLNMIHAFTKDGEDFAGKLAGHIHLNEEPAVGAKEAVSEKAATELKLVLSDQKTPGSVTFNFPPYVSSRLSTIKNVEEKTIKEAAKKNQLLYALLVAVDHYASKDMPSLQSCVRDSKRVQDYLEKRFYAGNIPGQGEKKNLQVHALKNKEATKAAILSGFENQMKQAGENDEVLFYFSGRSISTEPSKVNLANRENASEGLVPFDYDAKTNRVADFTEIRQIAQRYSHKNAFVTFLFDVSRVIPMDFIEEDNEKHIAFTGCFFNELSYETGDKGGIFTTAFLEALHNNQVPTYRELCIETLGSSAITGFKQTPFLLGNDRGWDRPFLGGEKTDPFAEILKLGKMPGPALPPLTTNSEISSFQSFYRIDSIEDLVRILRVTRTAGFQNGLAVSCISHDPINGIFDLWRKNLDVQLNLFSQRDLKIEHIGKLTRLGGKEDVDKRVANSSVLLLGIGRTLSESEDLLIFLKRMLFIAKLEGKETGIFFEGNEFSGDPYLKWFKTYPASRMTVVTETAKLELRRQLEQRLDLLLRIKKLQPVILPNSSSPSVESRINEAKKTKKLDLSNLRLTALPAEVEKLDIWDLNLQNNNFTKVPEQIKGLKLKRLFLNGNPISILPDWIYGMSTLSVLKIDNTNIKALSPLIGKLKNLQSFTLSNTKVEILPPELMALSLARLNVKNCPIINVDPKLLESPTRLAREMKYGTGKIPNYKLPAGKPCLFFITRNKDLASQLAIRNRDLVKKWGLPFPVPKKITNIEELPWGVCVILSQEEFTQPHLWFSLFNKYLKRMDFLYFNDFNEAFDVKGVNKAGSEEPVLPEYAAIRKVMRYFDKPVHFFYDGMQSIDSWKEIAGDTTAIIGRKNKSNLYTEMYWNNASIFFKYFLSGISLKNAFKLSLGQTKGDYIFFAKKEFVDLVLSRPATKSNKKLSSNTSGSNDALQQKTGLAKKRTVISPSKRTKSPPANNTVAKKKAPLVKKTARKK